MVKINIKSSTDNKFDVDVELGITVADFKKVIATKCSIPADQQRIIYSGRILKDHQTLDEIKIQDGHTVHLVKGAAPPPPPVEQQVPTPSNTQPQGIPGVPQNINDMMNNPMIQEMFNSRVMDSLLDNPDVFRDMMMGNPEMREVLNNNPEMAQMLSDPRQLRQSLEMMRNPELMREMMRNADRAMINIENHPEGFNLLRRMYTDIQEPLMNAANQQAASQNQTNSNPIQTNTDPNPNSQPLPNPWSSSSSSNPTSPPPSSRPTNTSASNPWASMFGGGGGMGGGTNNTGTTNNTGSTNTGASNPWASMFGGGGMGGGMGGMGGMEGMLGGMDPERIQQLMNNPVAQQIMQRMMADPSMMQQMISMNPHLRQMLDSNPQLREAMNNPEFFNMMANPENMNAMMQLQQAMGTLRNNGVFPGGMGGMGGGMGGMGGMDFSQFGNMFGGMGGMGNNSSTTRPPVNQEPPEQRFRLQLEQLEELGFVDRAANISALTSTNGNINLAIDRLLR
ncbi:hypothetical protein ACTFIY_010975 [Dictyostelium cf. discoideum]